MEEPRVKVRKKPITNTDQNRKRPQNGGAASGRKPVSGRRISSDTARRQPKSGRQQPSPRKHEQPKRPPQGRTVAQKPRRKQNFALYYIGFFILIVIVLVIMANTVLFKLSSVEINGGMPYTEEQLLAAGGIAQGQNLLHVDTKAAEEGILKAFIDVDSVTVLKGFPSSIVISLTKAEPYANINLLGKYAVISKSGRILSTGNAAPSDGLVTIIGIKTTAVSAGEMIADVDNKDQLELYATVISEAEKAGLSGITTLDISDKYELSLVWGGRVTLSLGGTESLSQKLSIAKTMIGTKIGENETATVLLQNLSKVYIQGSTPQTTTAAASKPVQTTASVPAQTDAESTDEPYSETIDSESDSSSVSDESSSDFESESVSDSGESGSVSDDSGLPEDIIIE